MSNKTRIGIVGCGNISDAYFKGAARSQFVEVKACADLRAEAVQAKADLHGAWALRVGCAPDTFMGASHQACRRLVDAGAIGEPLGGSVVLMSHGMEHWHPNPEFFFKPGGGLILDIGPSGVTQLVNRLGPVRCVAGLATMGHTTRTVMSQPLPGSTITVEVPTTVNGLLAFSNGCNVNLSASWDVWKHNRSSPIELYGTEGSVLGVEPNFFGNVPRLCRSDGDWQDVDISAHPFGIASREMRNGSMQADYRMVDMAMALRQGRAHRANGERALHVMEVLEAFETSSRTGRFVAMQTCSDRPASVPLGQQDEAVFA